jgi:hypothetical protein
VPRFGLLFLAGVASDFRSPGRPHKYIPGGAHVPVGVNSTRTVHTKPLAHIQAPHTSAGWREAEPMAVHSCGAEGHEPGLKPAMPAPTGISIAEILSTLLR